MSNQEPISYLTRALEICEQMLGATHPDTAQSLNNLATLYDSQGKYEEAEPLYRRACAIMEERLGLNHPKTKIVQENLANLLEEMKRREKE